MRKADEREHNLGEDDDDDNDYPSGLFGRSERKMFQDEILQQVVIGMGKLDASEEEQEWDGRHEEAALQQRQPLDTKAKIKDDRPRSEDVVNPYFPVLPSNRAASSAVSESPAVASTVAPATNAFATRTTTPTAGGKADAKANPVLHVSFAQLPVASSSVASYQPEDQVVFSPDWVPTDPPIVRQERESDYHGDSLDETDHGAVIEGEVDEQAAVGRLSSMSLMAAVTASGMLGFRCCR
jgi:serine/threonine-protein phosphatase 4 regulatory subunit 1